MFLNQMIEDFNFEDVLDIYENDRYFSYIREEYMLGEEDESVFNKFKGSSGVPKRASLEVLTLRKEGLMPRIYFIDHEDSLRGIEGESVSNLVTYPVDMLHSDMGRKAVIMIAILLLEHTYYKRIDEESKMRS